MRNTTQSTFDKVSVELANYSIETKRPNVCDVQNTRQITLGVELDFRQTELYPDKRLR